MKLIRTFAIATVLVTAAMGQSDKGGSQAKATPTPSPAKAASPASAKGQPAAPAAAKANPAATKSGPATKSSPATKAVPSTVKSGSIAPLPGAKTTAAKPANAAAKTQAPGAAPAKSAAKTGAAAPAKGAAKAGTTKKAAAAPATKTAAAASPKKTAAKTKAQKTATKKNVTPAKPVKASVVPTPPAPPLEKKAPAKLMGAAGRRDPFISPIRSVTTGSPTGNCTSGKRCLAIPELILQGTVRDISGKMMAIVVTSNRRTYTLRENDQVFNGSVEKITSDSIIFREFVRDALGRESAREVVKKLSPTT